MSNIHTLSDYRKSDGPNRQPLPNPWGGAQSTKSQGFTAIPPRGYTQAPTYGQPVGGYTPASNYPSYPTHDGTEMPAQQQGVRMQFCPSCEPCSHENKVLYKSWLKTFILWVSVVDICMFIVELGIGGFASPAENQMLGPPTATMYLLGGKWAPGILPPGWQLYRLIVPIFLHAGFIHIIMNLFFQLRIGLNMELRYGMAKIVTVYILSGIGGNIFSCVCRPFSLGVGASGALYGLVGVYTAHIIMNWSTLAPQEKCMSLYFLFTMLFATMMLGLWPVIDIFAHIGGFVIGFLIGTYFVRQDYPQRWFYMSVRARILFVCSVLLLIFMFIGMLAIMYTVTQAQVASYQ